MQNKDVISRVQLYGLHQLDKGPASCGRWNDLIGAGSVITGSSSLEPVSSEYDGLPARTCTLNTRVPGVFLYGRIEVPKRYRGHSVEICVCKSNRIAHAVYRIPYAYFTVLIRFVPVANTYSVAGHCMSHPPVEIVSGTSAIQMWVSNPNSCYCLNSTGTPG